MALDLYRRLKDRIFTMILYGGDYRIYINPDYVYVENLTSNVSFGYENNDLMLQHFVENKTPKHLTVLTVDPDKLKKYANIMSIVYSTKPFPKSMNCDMRFKIKRRITF